MSFSEEDKNVIVLYALEKLTEGCSLELDDENNWQELSSQMGRDWKEIRDVYRQWKSSSDVDDGAEALKNESPKLPNPSERKEINDEDLDEIQEINDLFGQDLPQLESNVGAAVEVTNADDGYQFADSMMQLLPVNTEYIDMDNIERINNDIGTLADINFQNQAVATANKRRRNLKDLDAELIETLIYKSEKELALKRQEHEKKMKIYEMHLEHGEELHQEKMEILRAKLRAVQDKIYHIDYAVCNRRLHKRFRSGPI